MNETPYLSLPEESAMENDAATARHMDRHQRFSQPSGRITVVQMAARLTPAHRLIIVTQVE
jgi:hypothetical protein